jgi:hypothetical protein
MTTPALVVTFPRSHPGFQHFRIIEPSHWTQDARPLPSHSRQMASDSFARC